MYTTAQDVIDKVPEEVILRLTDDEDAGEPDMGRIEVAISDAAAEIDAYAQKRYSVPFKAVPAVLKKLCEDIAIYNLYARRGLDRESADAVVAERYKTAVKFLEHLAGGKVDIGTSSPPPQPHVHWRGPKRVFSRESLEGM